MSMISLPEAFALRQKESLLQQYNAFAASLEQVPPISVRRNPRKGFNLQTAGPVRWSSTGFYLQDRPSFTLDPVFHGGSYYVQEASSMFLEQAILQTHSHATPQTVLDLCAAPGGKSTHLASLLHNDSLLISNEVIRSRASILAENLQKWGHSNVVVTNNDPQDFQRLPGFFDVIVVDAPCSGEGLFRKDPDAMKEWSEENVQLCSKRQRRILEDVWPSLKENGILIYSTCTYNRLENEENLLWLKQEHDVAFLSLQTDPSWGIEVVNEEGLIGYRFYPHQVKGEGFFLAVIQKREHTQGGVTKSQKNSFTSPSKKIVERLQLWVDNPSTKTFIQRDDTLQFFSVLHTPLIEQLAKNLRLIMAGTFLATIKHDKLIPEHAFALSTEINKSEFPVVNTTLEEALQYLRKENFHPMNAVKGFTLIQYQDVPLGWANVLDNRTNNLYPAEWRIRMK